MSSHEITHGKHKIKFVVHRKNVKNINLTLKPTLKVVISAHEDVSLDKIVSFVKRKASWIVKNKSNFEKSFPDSIEDKEYVSGESFKYLGKQYRLKVIEENEEHVSFQRGFIRLYCNDKKDTNKKAKLIAAWYEIRALKIFEKLLDKVYVKVKKYGVPKPILKTRYMKTRWGSCHPSKNVIILNKELIQAPKFCIEYVILHELLHFKYNDHSKKFYDLQESLMPDWKKRKDILDNEIVKYL